MQLIGRSGKTISRFYSVPVDCGHEVGPTQPVRAFTRNCECEELAQTGGIVHCAYTLHASQPPPFSFPVTPYLSLPLTLPLSQFLQPRCSSPPTPFPSIFHPFSTLFSPTSQPPLSSISLCHVLFIFDTISSSSLCSSFLPLSSYLPPGPYPHQSSIQYYINLFL